MFSQVDVTIRSLADVSSEPRPEALAAGAQPGRVQPLFLMELDIEDGRVGYATPLPRVVPVVTGVFDHAVTCVHGIPQLEPQIMENLFWSSQPVYQARLEEFMEFFVPFCTIFFFECFCGGIIKFPGRIHFFFLRFTVFPTTLS